MSNHKVPMADKNIVVQRLSKGMSTRQAIEGTSIRSNQTAARIAKEESNEITQLREDYVALIMQEAEMTSIERAKEWANMLKAVKPLPVRNMDYKPQAGTSYTGYTFVPDWNARYKALVYLDKLSGIYVENPLLQVNVMQQQAQAQKNLAAMDIEELEVRFIDAAEGLGLQVEKS